MDPETHQELPDGEQGVLVVRGPNITAGYLNDDDLTRRSFTDDGYLISGDVGYLDAGYIMICGRKDDIFGVGGEKVAPLEIERVLNRIPCVIRAAVCGLPDVARGKVPAAFVQLSQPADSPRTAVPPQAALATQQDSATILRSAIVSHNTQRQTRSAAIVARRRLAHRTRDSLAHDMFLADKAPFLARSVREERLLAGATGRN